MGYALTLRQVYYQLVARAIIANNERSYKNLGSLISDGRLAGLIDWTAIEDRTRNLRQNSHWDSPGDIVSACADQFQFDKWADQDYYVEVWVEKDALVGVVGQVCDTLDVPYFSCRGYVSQSEMWVAAQRFLQATRPTPQRPGWSREGVVLHLGDHDPSGRDMSRDIQDRLALFGVEPEFKRIALNMDQIEQYDPPPNPTKLTDSRCNAYIEEFGNECWELDALRPDVIGALIQDEVTAYCDIPRLEQARQREEEARSLLMAVADDWDQIRRQYGP